MKAWRVIALTVGTALFAGVSAQAQTPYKIQSIVKQGDIVGDPPIQVNSYLSVSELGDTGTILFDTFLPQTQAVIQFAGGKFTTILIGGGDAPGGKWPRQVSTYEPMSMNQRGNIAFVADVTIGGKTGFGTFLWDDAARKLTAVALKGMPAVNDLAFEKGGGWAPVINNREEIALVARVKNAAGAPRDGIFLAGTEGNLLPVALPDQDLPGDGKIDRAWLPSLNDAGVIAFLAQQRGQTGFSAYLWEQGTLQSLLTLDTDVPGGGKIANIRGIWINDRNRNALVLARVAVGIAASDGLYLLTGGKLLPVAVPGEEMPGGGKLKNLQLAPAEGFPLGVSRANAAGQHAFLARLEDNSTAAYLMDAEGKVSLILKSGTSSDLGAITRVGAGAAATNTASNGIALNSHGQVAFSATLADGPTALVLLTPAAP